MAAAESIRKAGLVAWGILGLAALLVLFGVVLYEVRIIFPPLVLAMAIVFIVNPIVTWLHARHIPRAGGVAITYIGFAAILVLVGFLVAPLAIDQADELSQQWPEVQSDVETWINDLAERSQDWIIQTPTVAEIEDSFQTDTDNLQGTIDRARDIGGRVLEVALILILGPILAVYLLVDLPHLQRVAESLIPERAKPEVHLMAGRLNRAIGGYFRGQLMVAFIVGVMSSVGLAIIDLPFWLIVGMIAGVFNLVPLIGPWVGAVPGIVIALTTRDFGTAVWVGVIMLIVQQIDNHFISPLVMHRTVRLHPVVVMMALLAGGALGGFFGLILAVPITAVLKIVIGHVWRVYVLGQSLDEVAEDWQRADLEPGVGFVEDVGDDDLIVGEGLLGQNEVPADEPATDPATT